MEEQPTTSTAGFEKRQRFKRWLVWSAMAWLLIRVLIVSAVDRQTPFLSANDRSRWCTVRSLVEEGTYRIDSVIANRGWDTIDKVSHYGSDGKQHYYSSKPPLLATMIAGIYLPINRIFGLTFDEHPFLIGRVLIFVTNGLLLLLLLKTSLALIEQSGGNDWSLRFAATVAAWATFLTTFAVTINNHLPAATAVAVVGWGLWSIWYEGRREPWLFAIVGLCSALAAANDLPCLSILAAAGVACSLKSIRLTAICFVPGVLLVAAAFFGTNKLAHDSWSPPYLHRATGQDWQGDNWYNYPGTYWNDENRNGVDRGEPSRLKYAFHTTLGHHGILSLTPVWLLCFSGCWWWASRRQRPAAALLISSLTAVCWLFYIKLPLVDRNYAGVCCGFRWTFWLIPLWIVAMLPTLDLIAQSTRWRRIAWFLFGVSFVSALYGSVHPWIHPWPYLLLQLK